MADDERRAEIEAMPSSVWLCPRPAHYHEWYVPHGGVCPEPDCGETLVEYRRSPQGEDHEAGIEELRREARERGVDRWDAEALLAAYLARVSPSRDGSVAVEDVALLEIARSVLEAAHGAPDDHARLRRATQALREGLAQ